MTNTKRPLTCIVALLFVSGAEGCGDARGPDRIGPDTGRAFVAQFDSVTLEENDYFYIGEPYAMALDQRGRIYVTDTYSGSVLQFKRSGETLRKYGRKGKGPGELHSPSALLTLGDSVLVVADAGNGKIVFFDIENGAVRREVHNIGVVASIDTIGGSLVLGQMDVSNKTSLAVLGISADTIQTFGPVPSEYFASPTLASIHPVSIVVSADSELFVGATGSGKIFRLGADGATRDSLVPPWLRRRGFRHDLAEQYNKPSSHEQKALLSSALVRSGVLSTGWLGLVHFDYSVNGSDVTARAFVSMLHWRTKTICVDREIALASHARPVVAVIAGMFVALEQVVTTGTRPVTTVRFFAPDYGVCREQVLRVSDAYPS